MHVTQRLKGGLPSIRWRRYRPLVEAAIVDCADRGDFRITDWSNQGNHLHIICEAKDKRALARGVQRLFIRIAKALNRLLGRKGHVFPDRYFAVILRAPRQVRNALAYALNNSRKHGRRYQTDAADPCSSGGWFEGWRYPPILLEPLGNGPPVAGPHTWLRRVGWRRHGLIDPAERPRG